MKAYIVSNTENGTDSIDGFYYLITEQGEVLASHWCSCSSFAMGDLYSTRPSRIQKFTQRFDSFEVCYLQDADITMEELMRRTRVFYGEESDDNKQSEHAM